MKKIILIEDDETLVKTLTTSLESENFSVESAIDGEEGLQLALKDEADLIILDLLLPSLNGLEICKELRAKKITTPIIILTGEKKEEIDKVLGLEIGADDYMLKPFGTRELIARVRAVLRRTIPEEIEIEEYSFGDVSINFKKQTALKGKKEIYLTAREFSLLKLLILNEGGVVGREVILDKVWGYDKFPTTRTIDTFIHNLRKKIENDPSKPIHFLTVPWSGYKFVK